MKVKIIKGTNQIGGCITEISTKKARIIIDFGADLPKRNEKQEIVNPNIEGLTIGNAKYDGVLVTHNHGDHIGLFNYVLEDIPVYVEEFNKRIHQILNDFTRPVVFRNTSDMIIGKTIEIKDIKITPYIVDHSAFNSVMLLIEADQKRLLYTGDYRNHGYKGEILFSTLEEIGQVDCVITEGTSFSRDEFEVYITEEMLSIKAVDIMKKYNQVFVLQATTNIDRLTAMYKASVKTNKVFFEDIFMANLTSMIYNETKKKNKESHIPNPISFENVFVYVPINKYITKDEEFRKKYIEPFQKYNDGSKLFVDYTMNVRISMIRDLKKLKNKQSITNACLIYSMWEGYEEEDSFKKFLKEVAELGITIETLHTSGHADVKTMIEVMNILKPKMIIPIHTTNKEKAKELFKNVVILEDNEEREV